MGVGRDAEGQGEADSLSKSLTLDLIDPKTLGSWPAKGRYLTDWAPRCPYTFFLKFQPKLYGVCTIIFILQMRKPKLRKANKVLEAPLPRGSRSWILTWVLQTSKSTLFPICCFSVRKQNMNHSSSHGFPGVQCLSFDWSKPICWIPFVTNSNVKMVLICGLLTGMELPAKDYTRLETHLIL